MIHSVETTPTNRHDSDLSAALVDGNKAADLAEASHERIEQGDEMEIESMGLQVAIQSGKREP